MNLTIIRGLAKSKKISLKRLADECGITEQSLHAIMRNNRAKIENITRIAKVLDVPVAIFFDDDAQTQTFNNITDNTDCTIQTGNGIIEKKEEPKEHDIMKGLIEEIQRLRLENQKLQGMCDAYKQMLNIK